MESLEALNNKQLRLKCVEYGMPNVPVTDSSRRVLIKRLEAMILAKASTPTRSNRRETVHVSKPLEVASSSKITVNNSTNDVKPATPSTRPSRRTIAVTERHVTTTTTVSEPENSDVSPDRVEPEPIRAKTITPEKSTTLYPKLPTKEPSPKPQVLSKTGVVITSYIRETTPINTFHATPEEMADLVEDYIAEKEPVGKMEGASQTVSEGNVRGIAPLTSSTHSSSSRFSSFGSYSYNQPSTSLSSNIRKSYIPPRTTYSKSSIASEYGHSYENDLEAEDDVVLEEESPIKERETPFLSQFARNLENLKATPIRRSVGPPEYVLHNRDRTRRTISAPPADNVYTHPSNSKYNKGGDISTIEYLNAINEEYHVLHLVSITVLFVVCLYLYLSLINVL